MNETHDLNRAANADGTKLVIRILGFANGKPCPYEGMFLAQYTPLHDNKGTFTRDIRKAKHYPDTQSLMADYRLSIGIRSDGRPNRPLTAFDCEVVRVSGGEDHVH